MNKEQKPSSKIIQLAIEKLCYLKGTTSTPIFVITENEINEYVDRINGLVVEVIDILKQEAGYDKPEGEEC